MTVIIGENDVGKTSVLYALQAFYSNKKLTSKNDFFSSQTDRTIVIEIDVQDPPNREPYSAAKWEDGTVRVRRTFAFDTDPLTETISRDGATSQVSKTVAKGMFPEENFHFVPVRRSLNEQFSMNKTALLGKTVRALMKQKLAAGEYSQTESTLRNALLEAIQPVREGLEIFLKDQLGDESVAIEFANLQIDLVEGVSFDIEVDDARMPDIPLPQRGAGTQNAMILALYRFVAKAQVSDFILALEEPENSFHPRGQRELLSALQRLSSTSQVICTTHSPVFIDRVDFRSNVILRRQQDGSTVSNTLDPAKLEDVRRILGIRPSDALLQGGGNCGIIAEGPSEQTAFPWFMKCFGIDDRKLGISILPLGGNDFAKAEAYVRLLDSYKLPCGLVLDAGSDPKGDFAKLHATGSHPMLKFVHILTRGSLEDYYPLALVKEALGNITGGAVQIADDDLFPNLNGKVRLKAICKRVYDKGYRGLGDDYLKIQLSACIPEWMYDRSIQPDDELRTVFESAKDVATQVN
jgi:ABC-type cobalamin/Fe3+-siderophores transport system ATPase subunit